MNFKDLASQLQSIVQQLIEAQNDVERRAMKAERWTIKAFRDDGDWNGELWFTDVYAVDEAEAWSQVAWLVNAFHMRIREVSLVSGKSDEYKQWERELLHK